MGGLIFAALFAAFLLWGVIRTVKALLKLEPAAAPPRSTAPAAEEYPLVRPTRHGGDPALVRTLEIMLAKHGLLYGAVISRQNVIADAGEPDGGQVNLVSAHIGPRGSTAGTIDSLEGMILPQVAGQGAYFAILDLIDGERGIVLIGKHEAPVADWPSTYSWMERVSAECKEMLRSA